MCLATPLSWDKTEIGEGRGYSLADQYQRKPLLPFLQVKIRNTTAEDIDPVQQPVPILSTNLPARTWLIQS
jgi:hypothetical protein